MSRYVLNVAEEMYQTEIDCLTIATAQAECADVDERASWLVTRWEDIKKTLVRMYVETAKECKRKMLGGHRLRVHRLNKAGRDAVPGTTTALHTEDLLEVEQSPVVELRKNLMRRKVALQARRGLLLLARQVHHPALSKKDFYRCISIKYLDNGIC